MASIVPPKIDADLPTTPAHEWANETSTKLEETNTSAAAKAALDPIVDRPPISTAVSTPGVEVPGGYPRGTDSEATTSSTGQAGQGGILDMAKQYLPAQQDVQGALLNARETAKQYLPPSVVAYLPGGVSKATTLPSEEGAQKPLEHSDGIGSLPGNASESSVAKLPDERANIESQMKTLSIQEEGTQKPLEHSGGVGSLVGSVPEPSIDKLPIQAQGISDTANPPTSALTPATSGSLHLDNISNASVQAQIGETPTMTPVAADVRGHKLTGGVGDLPGGESESTVALLPDERKEHNVQATSTNTSTIGSASRPRQGPTESNVAVSGHEALSNPTPTPSQAAPSSASENESKFTETETSEGMRKNHAEVGSTTSGGSDGSRSVGGTPRKPKLMEKIKGEVKVITGKLGGKEEKVEEGRRLMGKV